VAFLDLCRREEKGAEFARGGRKEEDLGAVHPKKPLLSLEPQAVKSEQAERTAKKWLARSRR